MNCQVLELNNNNKSQQKKPKWKIFPNEVKYRVVVSLRSAKPVIAQVTFLTHSVFTEHCRADCYRPHMLCICDNSTVEIAFLFIAIVYFWSLMKEAYLVFSCVKDVKLKTLCFNCKDMSGYCSSWKWNDSPHQGQMLCGEVFHK